MITKIDYYIAGFAGFFTGIFLIPTLVNLGIRERIILLLLPLIIPPLWIFGLWLGDFLAKWFAFFRQFTKFAIVGFLNAAIDFGILNLLSAVTGITSGFIIGGVNVPGFSLAVINSYFWNKLWVFKDRDEKNIFSDLPKFLGVTLIGLVINSGIVIVVTTYVSPWFGLSLSVWLNLAKVSAAVLSLIWNFLGYKFLVFNRSTI